MILQEKSTEKNSKCCSHSHSKKRRLLFLLRQICGNPAIAFAFLPSMKLTKHYYMFFTGATALFKLVVPLSSSRNNQPTKSIISPLSLTQVIESSACRHKARAAKRGATRLCGCGKVSRRTVCNNLQLALCRQIRS